MEFGSGEFGQGFAVEHLHCDSGLKREAVLNVAHLIENVLHLFGGSEEPWPMCHPLLVTEAYEVAAFTVLCLDVLLVVVDFDRLVDDASNLHHLAGEALLPSSAGRLRLIQRIFAFDDVLIYKKMFAICVTGHSFE